MTYEQLLGYVMQYFADKSRPKYETLDDLRNLAAECDMLADSLEE